MAHSGFPGVICGPGLTPSSSARKAFGRLAIAPPSQPVMFRAKLPLVGEQLHHDIPNIALRTTAFGIDGEIGLSENGSRVFNRGFAGVMRLFHGGFEWNVRLFRGGCFVVVYGPLCF